MYPKALASAELLAAGRMSLRANADTAVDPNVRPVVYANLSAAPLPIVSRSSSTSECACTSTPGTNSNSARCDDAVAAVRKLRPALVMGLVAYVSVATV
jgi:hypothetical protein